MASSPAVNEASSTTAPGSGVAGLVGLAPQGDAKAEEKCVLSRLFAFRAIWLIADSLIANHFGHRATITFRTSLRNTVLDVMKGRGWKEVER
jgi:hypothetical protein